MRSQSEIPNPKTGIPGGFTLVELLVVMVIIAIIVGFIANAALDARRRAEERATQALITKLETGLNDRVEALLLTRPDAAQAHKVLAAIYVNNIIVPTPPATGQPWTATTRSQVIAWYDYIKSELPDVFFVQPQPGSGPYYPLNFAARAYPGTAADSAALGNFILPLGHTVLAPHGDVIPNDASTNTNPAGTGIYGASYTAAAGLYKNLGYLPQGYDMVDNNQNGYIDEWAEGVNGTNQATVVANLANHKHITARSEALYALLVEGRGPLGAVFNPDDFTEREVQDTDGDGMPEFVDAWGQPLQFFRWPMLYHSDLQRGQALNPASENAWTAGPPYLTAFQEREQNPLDQNQQLMAPAWWSLSYNNNFNSFNGASFQGTAFQVGGSGAVQAFEYYFHLLHEPYPRAGGPLFWDRGTTYGARRAYYSKFLIVSSGVNQQLGVFLYSDAALSNLSTPAKIARALIANENNAMPFSVNDVADFTQNATLLSTTIVPTANSGLDPNNPTSYDLMQAAQDDISNQNIQTTIAIGGSG